MTTMTTMATVTTITRMTTDSAKLMRLMSWLSPAFPIGAYSYSHGLEWAVEAGTVRDRVTLVDWLDADLRYGAGRADAIFFAEAWRAVVSTQPLHGGQDAPADGVERASPKIEGTERDLAAHPLIAVAELAAAMRATSELALEASQQGVAFLTAVRKAWPHPALDLHANAFREAGITPMLPIAAGLACAVHDIALNLALPLYLHAGAANLINAAIRLIPLGQSDGLMTQAALETAIAETAAEARQTGISGIGSAAFMIDIASMQHEAQYTRLFRS
jgi:urease accessory protein